MSDHLAHGLCQGGLESGGVKRFALVFGDHVINQAIRAGDTADVGGLCAVGTAFHVGFAPGLFAVVMGTIFERWSPPGNQPPDYG